MYKTKFIHIKSCSNTIEYAKSYLSVINNLLENIIITSDIQTKGVGKFNRIWISPKGNLYLTAIFKPFNNYSWRNFKDLNIFNLLISLSVINCIRNVLPKLDYSIFAKWPNDIILNDAKVSGILLENLTDFKQEILLVSIGLNVNIVPKINNMYKATSLKEVDKNINITLEKFSKILIETIYNNIIIHNKEEVIKAWKKVAYKLNEMVKLKIGNEVHNGIFRDINEDGSILLQLDEKNIKTFSAGEVY